MSNNAEAALRVVGQWKEQQPASIRWAKLRGQVKDLVKARHQVKEFMSGRYRKVHYRKNPPHPLALADIDTLWEIRKCAEKLADAERDCPLYLGEDFDEDFDDTPADFDAEEKLRDQLQAARQRVALVSAAEVDAYVQWSWDALENPLLYI